MKEINKDSVVFVALIIISIISCIGMFYCGRKAGIAEGKIIGDEKCIELLNEIDNALD